MSNARGVLQMQRADGSIVGHGTEHLHAQGRSRSQQHEQRKRSGSTVLNPFTIADVGAAEIL